MEISLKLWFGARAGRWITALAVICLGLAGRSTAQPIERIYVFGDSLSDIGNLAAYLAAQEPPVPPPPHYYPGRGSNGPVWVEVLASDLGTTLTLAQNFAWGGARSGGENTSSGDVATDLAAQVTRFLVQGNSFAPTRTIFVVAIGANDYLSEDNSPPAVVATNIESALRRLVAGGARRMLVANLPDLGETPIAAALGNPERRARLSSDSFQHNRAMAALILVLREEYNHDFRLVDLEGLFASIAAAPASYGFANFADWCVNGESVCAGPDQLVWWDMLHPSAATHRHLAEAARAALDAQASDAHSWLAY